ncbi:MAG: hypothetical protein QOG14_2695 [Mycobacterium sp.]|jgi:hypothetical protein|nr:hypothetical protein [Mycobacterium sp.]
MRAVGLTEVGGPEEAFAYWAAVMIVAVFGKLAADIVHRLLGPSKSPNASGTH